MFSKILEFLRGVVNKVLGKKDLHEILNVDAAISDKMRNAIVLWKDMYMGEAPWIKEPTYEDPVRIVSLGLPAFIASEKARMATLEMKSVITDGKNSESDDDNLNTRAGYLNSQYKKLLKNIRKQIEYGIALGGLVIKPYLYVDNTLEFSFTTADNFYPITFDSTGRITCAAFLDTFKEGKVVYTKVELHSLDIKNKTISIVNKVYRNDLTSNYNRNNPQYIGTCVPIHSVPIWQDIPEETTIKNVDRLLFSYFRMPEANTVDPDSSLGVSAYSRAKSLIKDADMQYSRLLWEFEGGELAIDMDRDALRVITAPDGRLVEQPSMMQRRLCRKVDLNEEGTYEVYNPNLRDISIINGLNTIFMRIEDVCGISRGVISDITRSEAKTATEMLILKQRSFATNRDIQTALQYALEDVVYVMNVYCDLYSLAPEGKYCVSYDWDDSLITSPDEELERRLQLKHEQIDSRLEIRMWYYGETEKQAMSALEKIDKEQQKAMELQEEAFNAMHQNGGDDGTNNSGSGNDGGKNNPPKKKNDGLNNKNPPNPNKTKKTEE